MRGGFGEIKTSKRNKRQRIERTRARTKKSVVKTDATASNQGERQTVQTTLSVFFAKLWHQQKIETNTDNQNR
ncbi:hypothetical protein D3C72_1900650 [compost metagenome]